VGYRAIQAERFAATNTNAEPAPADGIAGAGGAEMPDANLVRAAGELRVAVSRIVRRFRQQWVIGELTAAELSVLTRLDQSGPCGLAALASAEQVSAPAVCVTLTVLQDKGLVARGPDPEDGRRVVVSLTENGLADLTARRSALAGRLVRVLAEDFNEAEREQILALVPLLHRLSAQL
jgi:DNA-binding MarR family transcriptional regulator